ncbi:MAG: ABC transporter ATP-binding protein [Acidimicrobiia bacterium]|nr:ABC transporter ATP-binding protein [Acidimicrobiia bacterium]
MGLAVHGLVKRFGAKTALAGVDLEVNDGEVLAVLGPSGCGKSTMLRVIAGLESPDAGTVQWGGVDITSLPTHERGFGLMFQGYALFPHRTVGENVGFGLKMQGVERHEVEVRVADALSWVGLDGFARRHIEGLSGGEQQRVALARTLAPEPRLVMLDEPLGALDRRLRDRLVDEVAELLRARNATALYVTHDHDEADTVSDRVALMRSGVIAQVGTLAELRSAPADDWVADFVR